MKKFFASNKMKIFVSLLIVISAAFLFSKEKKQEVSQEVKQEKKPLEVSVVRAGDQKNNLNSLRFSGTIVGDQEIQITSQSSGVVKSVNFDLGDKVSAGKVLVTIDDQSSSYLSKGENNFASAQVQRLELAVEQTKKAYSLAKDNYDANKSDATKTAKDIAKLQYESAQVELNNALNARTIISPIFGVVTERKIAIGDSVAPGQVLATISKNSRNKVQFYLSADEMKKLSIGANVKVIKGEQEIAAKVFNIAPQADTLTKKFLVEAYLESSKLLLGEVVEVWLQTADSRLGLNNFYLPLSAISNTQTGSYIFIAEGDIARLQPISLVSISGETAVVKSELADDAKIIIEGNKLASDGDKIKIK